MQSQIMDSANDHDPLTTIVLLATTEVQEFLEGIMPSPSHSSPMTRNAFAETFHEGLALQSQHPLVESWSAAESNCYWRLKQRQQPTATRDKHASTLRSREVERAASASNNCV